MSQGPDQSQRRYGPEDLSMEELIEAARQIVMTPKQAWQQRLSFAYGNCRIENPLVTREVVAAAGRQT